MRTPVDGFTSDDRQEAKDARYPVDASWQSLAGAQPWVTRIAVKSVNRIVIVQVADIIRIEAEDNYVRLWAERPYLHKETLTGLVARLSPQHLTPAHRRPRVDHKTFGRSRLLKCRSDATRDRAPFSTHRATVRNGAIGPVRRD